MTFTHFNLPFFFFGFGVSSQTNLPIQTVLFRLMRSQKQKQEQKKGKRHQQLSICMGITGSISIRRVYAAKRSPLMLCLVFALCKIRQLGHLFTATEPQYLVQLASNKRPFSSEMQRKEKIYENKEQR